MFSGIVEAKVQILNLTAKDQAYQLSVQRPDHFQDIKLGDSICTNGVCLTVESMDSVQLTFTLAAETIKVLRFDPQVFKKHKVNLERSLKFGDRIHGHMVTGHVEDLAQVIRSEAEGDSWWLDVRVNERYAKYLLHKGSVCLNGVSLTLNSVQPAGERQIQLSVCLIPETVAKTNLAEYAAGEWLNFESDYFVKSMEPLLQNFFDAKVIELKAQLKGESHV